MTVLLSFGPEQAPIEDQSLIPGVPPITPVDRLTRCAEAPCAHPVRSNPPITACSISTRATNSTCSRAPEPDP